MCSITGYSEEVVQNYSPPYFLESYRLEKIEPLFPEIDKMYREYAKENHFPGYSYGIILDGQLVCSGSGGFLDLEKKIPVTTESMFRIASMTKSFVALAILKLRDEGKIRLDDPISLYIRETKEWIKDASVITIRDLLMHTAGLPKDDPWADRKLAETEEELLAFLKKGVFFSNPPGMVFEYSNLGYALLGLVINKITGMSFEEYIDRTICEPIGMKIAWEYQDIPKTDLAEGYRLVNEQWEKEPLLHAGIFGAMGGMITSVKSFSRYVALHLSAWPPREEEEHFLKRSSIREMQKPWQVIKPVSDFEYAPNRTCALLQGYGYGLRYLNDSFGRVLVGHGGGLPGFGSSWYIMPEYGLGVILFANLTYAEAWTLNQQVLDKLVEESQILPRQLPASQILQRRQKELVQFLFNGEGSDFFANNFFLDHPDGLKNEINRLFSLAGKILSIEEVVPKNQLRGFFIIRGEKANIQVDFSLTPENPSLIQELQMKEVPLL